MIESQSKSKKSQRKNNYSKVDKIFNTKITSSNSDIKSEYIYFLITEIIQSILIISPLNWLTAIVPLILVLGVSMIRELVEDLGINKYDN